MPEAPTFEACGKQILRNGEHFLDAASAEIAQAVCIMLREGILCFISQQEEDLVREHIWGVGA